MKLIQLLLGLLVYFYAQPALAEHPNLEHCDSDDAVCVGKVILKVLSNQGPGPGGQKDILGVACEDRDNDGKFVFYQLAFRNGSIKEYKVYGTNRGSKFTKKMCEDIVARVPKSCGREDKKVQFFGCQDGDLDGKWLIRSIKASSDGSAWVSENSSGELTEAACKEKIKNYPNCVF